MLICCFFSFSSFIEVALANYYCPVMIIKSGWGANEYQFGFQTQDTSNLFPIDIGINEEGLISISDIVNKRVKVYMSDGRLKSVVQPKEVENTRYGWPTFMSIDSNGNIFTSNHDHQLQKYDIDGKLLWVQDVYVGSINVLRDDSVIISGCRPNMKGKEINPDGIIIKTYKNRPIELGHIAKKRKKADGFDIKVDFLSSIYNFRIEDFTPEDQLARDLVKTLYVIQRRVKVINDGPPGNTVRQNYRVVRIDKCGNPNLMIDLPENEYAQTSAKDSSSSVVKEYGSPQISPFGDIYCWARTESEYKILKWTWQGEPDAPQNLTAKRLDDKIRLEWKSPIQDPKSVRGYEIVRSADVCGAFSPLATVGNQILQFIDDDLESGKLFYYQVRAIRDKSFSGFSNRVAGQISK